MILGRSCLVALAILLAGCASTKESKRSQELLDELRPRFAQLRDGMPRSEVEAILKPDKNATGRLVISGFIISDYTFLSEVRATLFFAFPPNVRTIEEMHNSPLPDDVLNIRMSSVEIYDHDDWLGRSKWVKTPISQMQ